MTGEVENDELAALVASRQDFGQKCAAVLWRARQLISNPDDWGKGLAECEAGRHCVGAAIRVAAADSGEEMWVLAVGFFVRAAEIPLSNALDHFNEVRDEIIDWNDAPDRTHTQVLTALDKAAAMALGNAEFEPGAAGAK